MKEEDVKSSSVEEQLVNLVSGSEQSALAPRKPVWLGDIAAYDPKLAWTLLEAGRAPGGYVDFGGWEAIVLSASWTAATVDTLVTGQTYGIVEADMWVRKVTYTVRRPQAFAGSVLKSMSDFFNSKQPNIDFTFEVKSYTNYLIAMDPIPLELIENTFDFVAPAGLVLRANAQLRATFTNKRVWADAELPVDVAVVLHALRLPAGLYGRAGDAEANSLLQELGLKR